MIPVMHSLFNYYKNTLFAICYISLLTGCCDPARIGNVRPFRDAQESIIPGQTTREGVHGLLGNPICCSIFLWPSIDEGNVEAFGPVLQEAPCGDLDHYALIIYDATGRVDATDWEYTYSGNTDSGTTLYADGYGYNSGANTIFPSKDGGGKADKAWAGYLETVQLPSQYWDKPIYKHSATKDFCRAFELSHPAAFNELGNLFWKGSHATGKPKLWSAFEHDNVKTCLWYSMANGKVQPPWCHDLLTVEETETVERLLENWQPSQCPFDLLPGFGYWESVFRGK